MDTKNEVPGYAPSSAGVFSVQCLRDDIQWSLPAATPLSWLVLGDQELCGNAPKAASG